MPTENTLRNIVTSGIFIIPFISLLVFSSLYFPYITGKNIAFRLIILVISAVYAFVLWRGKEYRPHFGMIGTAFAVFIGIMFIANIFGVSPHKSFFSNFERMEGFFTLLLLFFYFVIITGVLKTEKTWERLLNTFLSAGVLMAIFALAESSNGIDRVSSQLGNPTYLAAFMLFNIFFAIFLLIRYVERINLSAGSRYSAIATYLAIILLDFYVLYRTGTRGAFLGFLAGIVFTAVLFAIFEKRNKKLRFTGIGLLLIAVISVGLLYAYREAPAVQNSPILSRFSALVSAPTNLENYASTQGKSRFAIWSIALQGVQERPILGWGQENFNYIFNKYYDPKIYDQEQWFDRAHNVFFDWLVAGGIMGLLSYLSLFALAFYVLWRKKREDVHHHFSFADKTLISALLIAYFIHNLFVFDSLSSYILFFTVLGFVSIHEKPIDFGNKLNVNFLRDEKNAMAMAGVFTIVCAAGVYFLVIAPAVSSAALINALTDQNTFTRAQTANVQTRDIILNRELSSFKTSIDYGVIGRAEAREQLLQNAAVIVVNENVRTEIKNSYDQLVQREMTSQLTETPNDARFALFYASYLSRVGRYEEAFKYYKRAEELSPNKQTLLFDQGFAYINADRPQDALPIFERAYNLEKSNATALSYYITALIYAGDNTKASELREPIRYTAAGTDLKIMKAYLDTKQTAMITTVLNDRLVYAENLANSGDREGAIQIIRETISINPNLMQQKGQALIDKIQAQQ
jgi:O-antigen ligase